MTHQAMKPIYRLRHKRCRQPSKPEFAMTGILVGIVIGWIAGFGLELVLRKNMPIMMATAIAGLVLGSCSEAIRFWWRMRRFRAGNQPNPARFHEDT